MNNDRWNALMADDELPLTDEERAQGWHFCTEFDGLLVGPGMSETEFCTSSCPPRQVKIIPGDHGPITPSQYERVKPLPDELFYQTFPGVYCRKCGQSFALYSYSAHRPHGIDENRKPYYNECALCTTVYLDVDNKFKPGPACPKCKSSSQIWRNQETGRLTCHRVGCHGHGGLDE